MSDQRLYRVGEAAAILTKAFGSYGEEYRARQLRHLVQHGGIRPVAKKGEGRTAAALFTIEEVAAAEVMSVLIDFGFVTKHYRGLRTLMDTKRPWHETVSDVARGQTWGASQFVVSPARHGHPMSGGFDRGSVAACRHWAVVNLTEIVAPLFAEHLASGGSCDYQVGPTRKTPSDLVAA